jgi:hypothetical protein
MTRFRTAASTALITGMLFVAVSGCEKGAAERAGEDIDDSVEKIGKSLEETGESIYDSGRAAGD